MFLPRFFFLISFIKISGNIWVSDFIFKRLFNAVFWNSTLSQPDVDTQYIRRVIWQSFNSHFAYNKKTFYETYSRVRQEIGGFLLKNLVEWVRSRRTCASNLEFKSRELSFLAKLFSPRHTMAHFHMLRAYLLFRGIYDLFCHGLNWFRKCFERAPPNSDALNFLFLFPPIYRPVADENLWKVWSFSRKQLNEVKQQKKRVCIKVENKEESCLFVTKNK